VPAQYSNRVCPCGYTRFRERRTPVLAALQRWMQFDAVSEVGLGATPLGLWFGAGVGGYWGRFTSTHRSTRVDTICESCGRVRSTKNLGGLAVFGSYVEDGYFYILGAGVTSVGCFVLRLEGSHGQVFETPLQLTNASPSSIVADPPLETAALPPLDGLLASDLMRAVLPEVGATGTFTVTLIDRCSGTTLPLVSLILESSPMIFTPFDADLGGAPVAWLRGDGVQQPAAQPSSASRVSIPFDKCTGVMEFDARFGTLPSAQGWTHQGAGLPADYQLVEGGVLRAQTTAGQFSYWSQTLALSANPVRAFSYAVIKDGVTPITDTGFGEGINFECRYSLAAAGTYHGVRYTYHATGWYYTRLNNSNEGGVHYVAEPSNWTWLGAGDDSGSGNEALWGQVNMLRGSASLFGTDGAPVALEAIGSWGYRAGASAIDAFIRNVVFSVGGRFIRPMFTAYAGVSNPLLRLYMIADIASSVDKTARFTIRYGTGMNDPYEMPPLTAGVTVNFTSANTMYEVPVSLPGLTANQPFWFAIERAWDHADDLMSSTVHLMQATVRAL